MSKRIVFKNFLDTISSFIRNNATVSREWIFPDRDGTVALTDITPQVIYKTTTTQSFTTSLNEKILGKVLIPAGTILAGDILQFKSINTKVGTAGNFATKLKASASDPGAIGADYSSGTLIGSVASTNVNLLWSFIRTIVFKTTSSEEVYPTGVTSAIDDGVITTGALSTLTIDFTTDQWIVVTGQQTSGTGADTMRLNSWFLILIRG